MKRKILSILAFLCILLVGATAITAAAIPNNEENGEKTWVSVPAETENYLVIAENDLVCVYQNGTLVCSTGIQVAGLPQGDRALLEEGITVEDGAEVAALLEDLGA
jgi:hypothetical protein